MKQKEQHSKTSIDASDRIRATAWVRDELWSDPMTPETGGSVLRRFLAERKGPWQAGHVWEGSLEQIQFVVVPIDLYVGGKQVPELPDWAWWQLSASASALAWMDHQVA